MSERSRAQRVDEAHIITAVPDADRAQAFARRVAASVHATAWRFARFDREGGVTETAGTEEQPERADWMQQEYRLQASRPEDLPRVARTLAPSGRYRAALTVLYGQEYIGGVLVVLRDGTKSPFTRTDVEALRASLEEGTELLARLRLVDGEQTIRQRAEERQFPAMYVLSPDLRVEYCWQPEADDVLHEMLAIDESLPPAILEAVRTLTAGWTADRATRQAGVAVPLPYVLLRVNPLEGQAGSYRIGVQIERFRSRNALQTAARRYAMSSRELQVLALVLQGRGTSEVAAALHIAESTAHDHIKRMLLKTRARNRVEMAAKALGWRAS